MITDVISFTIVVRDQDEALAFYVDKLGFEKRADQPMGNGLRWVTVAPQHANVVFVLQPLAWFEGEEREERQRRIGKGPTTVLRVDDCHGTSAMLRERGVKITQEPTKTFYGVEANIADLYGNTLVLLEQQM
ncbi:MAG: VOC family protein [Chloroflexi bacterium]|nr:VOC family protein [Chloroflexota bacterium]